MAPAEESVTADGRMQSDARRRAVSRLSIFISLSIFNHSLFYVSLFVDDFFFLFLCLFFFLILFLSLLSHYLLGVFFYLFAYIFPPSFFSTHYFPNSHFLSY